MIRPPSFFPEPEYSSNWLKHLSAGGTCVPPPPAAFSATPWVNCHDPQGTFPICQGLLNVPSGMHWSRPISAWKPLLLPFGSSRACLRGLAVFGFQC